MKKADNADYCQGQRHSGFAGSNWNTVSPNKFTGLVPLTNSGEQLDLVHELADVMECADQLMWDENIKPAKLSLTSKAAAYVMASLYGSKRLSEDVNKMLEPTLSPRPNLHLVKNENVAPKEIKPAESTKIVPYKILVAAIRGEISEYDAFDNANLLGQLSTAATQEAIEIWNGFLEKLKVEAENDGNAWHFKKVLEDVLQNGNSNGQDQRRKNVIEAVLHDISENGETTRVIEEALEWAIIKVMTNSIAIDYKPQIDEFLSSVPEFHDNPTLFNIERNIIIQSKYPNDEIFVQSGHDLNDNPNLNVSIYYKTAIRWFLDQGGSTAMLFSLGHELAEGYAAYFGWDDVKLALKKENGKIINVAHDIVVREGFPNPLDDPSGVFGSLYAEAGKNQRTPFEEIKARFQNAMAALKEEALKRQGVS